MIVLVIGCTLLWALFHREMFAILFDICPQAHLLLPQLTLDLCPKSFLAHAGQDSILNHEKEFCNRLVSSNDRFSKPFDIDLPELGRVVNGISWTFDASQFLEIEIFIKNLERLKMNCRMCEAC